jgi:hypothetical protein
VYIEDAIPFETYMINFSFVIGVYEFSLKFSIGLKQELYGSGVVTRLYFSV